MRTKLLQYFEWVLNWLNSVLTSSKPVKIIKRHWEIFSSLIQNLELRTKNLQIYKKKSKSNFFFQELKYSFDSSKLLFLPTPTLRACSITNFLYFTAAQMDSIVNSKHEPKIVEQKTSFRLNLFKNWLTFKHCVEVAAFVILNVSSLSGFYFSSAFYFWLFHNKT